MHIVPQATFYLCSCLSCLVGILLLLFMPAFFLPAGLQKPTIISINQIQLFDENKIYIHRKCNIQGFFLHNSNGAHINGNKLGALGRYHFSDTAN